MDKAGPLTGPPPAIVEIVLGCALASAATSSASSRKKTAVRILLLLSDYIPDQLYRAAQRSHPHWQHPCADSAGHSAGKRCIRRSGFYQETQPENSAIHNRDGGKRPAGHELAVQYHLGPGN